MNKWILYIVALILGMLSANMLINVCGCNNVVEGSGSCDCTWVTGASCGYGSEDGQTWGDKNEGDCWQQCCYGKGGYWTNGTQINPNAPGGKLPPVRNGTNCNWVNKDGLLDCPATDVNSPDALACCAGWKGAVRSDAPAPAPPPPPPPPPPPALGPSVSAGLDCTCPDDTP